MQATYCWFETDRYTKTTSLLRACRSENIACLSSSSDESLRSDIDFKWLLPKYHLKILKHRFRFFFLVFVTLIDPKTLVQSRATSSNVKQSNSEQALNKKGNLFFCELRSSFFFFFFFLAGCGSENILWNLK